MKKPTREELLSLLLEVEIALDYLIGSTHPDVGYQTRREALEAAGAALRKIRPVTNGEFGSFPDVGVRR